MTQVFPQIKVNLTSTIFGIWESQIIKCWSIPTVQFCFLCSKVNLFVFGKRVLCASQTHSAGLFFFFFSALVNNNKYCLYMVWKTNFTVYILFIISTTTLFKTKILKIGSTILFIYLKIILLQYFSVFNFQFSIFSCIIILC